MKSRTWMCTTAVSLFAAVALPIGMDAQNNSSQNHGKRPILAVLTLRVVQEV